MTAHIQQGALLDVLKKKMRQTKEEMEKYKDECEEFQKRLQAELVRREEVSPLPNKKKQNKSKQKRTFQNEQHSRLFLNFSQFFRSSRNTTPNVCLIFHRTLLTRGVSVQCDPDVVHAQHRMAHNQIYKRQLCCCISNSICQAERKYSN